MKTFVPDYYAGFSCLMGACRHSCCIGWEIDIDEEKLAYYQSVQGDFGKRLKANICADGEQACFRLDAEERCPFLNRDGLCDMILELGEDSLCQICADHPRFRNFFSDRVEIGLGLCCEAAGQLILKHQDAVRFVMLEEDGESEFPDEEEQELLELRAEAIAIAQNRAYTLAERMEQLAQWAALPCPVCFDGAWTDFFGTLECLDGHWRELLASVRMEPSPLPAGKEWEIAFEQILVYLLQRHIPGALDDGDFTGRIAFVLLAADLLRRLSADAQCIDDLAELARMYSSEIEYSDENIEAILAQLHARCPGI